jgi:hypothetical protein
MIVPISLDTLGQLLQPLAADDPTIEGPTAGEYAAMQLEARDRVEGLLGPYGSFDERGVAATGHAFTLDSLSRQFRTAANTVWADVALSDTGRRQRLDAVYLEKTKACVALATAVRKTGSAIYGRFGAETLIARPTIIDAPGDRIVPPLLQLAPELAPPDFLVLLRQWAVAAVDRAPVPLQVLSFLLPLARGLAREARYSRYIDELRDLVQAVEQRWETIDVLSGRYARNRTEQIHDAFAWCIRILARAPLNSAIGEITSPTGQGEPGLIAQLELNVIRQALEAPHGFAGFMASPNVAAIGARTVQELIEDLGA